ncbi:hypothetical protein [Bogoriella caseilytica]|uniref:Saccharopine dehydrogenase-like NADP-dependent oxidoreductase n=1 Tax=Bogoriella caseilytica TaxID=56055 RepID=A0A3N2B9V9_9MICO|nr:hypothetical protein [Bogoriella caseilytica]ROR72041.1 saccharopine dehydrogenase-like NADP-dependent oxidoreductase [Bogoriella caseilytica]
MSARTRVLVIGASGTLGSQIGTALEEAGCEVLRGVRSPLRPGDIPVDINDRRSLQGAAAHVDLVVVAVPHIDPLVQQVCAQAAVPCLDVSPHLELRDSARRALREQGPPSIVMCGLYPGLSGILASHVAAGLDEVEEISVGLLQSTNAHVGPAGVRDMLASLARPVPKSGGMAPGFRRRRRMQFGGREATVRLVRYDESQLLRERFSTSEINYFTAWDSQSFTAAIAALQRVGLLSRLVRSTVDLTPRHNPRAPQTVHLRAEAHGSRQGRRAARALEVEAESDYGATALMVVAVARRLLARSTNVRGVVSPMDVLALSDLAPLIEAGRLRLSSHEKT